MARGIKLDLGTVDKSVSFPAVSWFGGWGVGSPINPLQEPGFKSKSKPPLPTTNQSVPESGPSQESYRFPWEKGLALWLTVCTGGQKAAYIQGKPFLRGREVLF